VGVCGPDDAQFLRHYVRGKTDIAVIPNGVDTDFFTPKATHSESRAAHPMLLFCGAMDYQPNVDAMDWYFSEMHQALLSRIPELRVLIAGRDPTPSVKRYESPRVIVTGAVPDVRPYYRQAWLQMVPLRIGGGTRLKIVESLAMGTPVVSTSIGAQGLGLQRERDILIADTGLNSSSRRPKPSATRSCATAWDAKA
jgi:glycosyltransferase involved in cell wall biosynthesis